MFFKTDGSITHGGFGDVMVATLGSPDSPTLVAVKSLRQLGTKVEQALLTVVSFNVKAASAF